MNFSVSVTLGKVVKIEDVDFDKAVEQYLETSKSTPTNWVFLKDREGNINVAVRNGEVSDVATLRLEEKSIIFARDDEYKRLKIVAAIIDDECMQEHYDECIKLSPNVAVNHFFQAFLSELDKLGV